MHIDRHPSSVPGDLVRDRKTQTDYIIQGVEAATIVGLVTVRLVDVITSKTREEVMAWDDLQRDFMTIRPNTRRLQPTEALSEIRQLLSKGLNDENLFQQLAQEENAPLRDILYISGSVTENTFSQGIVQFTQSVILGLGGKPNKDSIYQIFRQSVPESSATDEFLMSVAERVHSTSDFVALSLGKGTSLNAAQNQELVEFFRSGEYKFAREAGLLTGRPFRQMDLPALSKRENAFLEKLMGGSYESRALFGAFPTFRDMPNLAERERKAYIAEEIYKIMAGRGQMSPMMKTLVRKGARDAEKMRVQGRAAGFYQQILKKSQVEEAIANNQDMTQLQQMRKLESLMHQHDINLLTHNYFPSMRKTRRRARNWDQFGLDYSAGLNGVDWQSLRQHLHDRAADGDEMLSITHEAFMSSLIGERGFRLKGKDTIMHLSNPEHAKELQEAMGVGTWNKSGSTLVGRGRIRNLLEARNENMVLDLASILDDSRVAQASISIDDLAMIRDSHFTTSGARSIASKSGVNIFGIAPSARGRGLHRIGDESVLSDRSLPLHERVEKFLKLNPAGDISRLFAVEDDQAEVWESTSLRDLFSYINAHPGKFKSKGFAGRRGILYRDVPGAGANFGVRRSTASMDALRPIAENLGEGNFRRPGDFVRALSKANTSSLALTGRVRHMQGSGGGGGVLGGRAAYKAAVAKLTSSSNNIEHKVLGTGIPYANINSQMDLINNLFKGRSLIVDIETRMRDASNPGSLYLSQIAWGSSAHAVESASTRSSVQRAKAIIQFAKAAQGMDVVASHGEFDPKHLLEFARRLESDPHVIGQGLLKDLVEARQTIERTLQDNRWLDLTVMHAMRTGESQARVNQAYLQIRYLTQNRIERHTARKDVQDAWALALQGQEDILGNLHRTKLHTGGDVANAGMMVMETDQMGNNYGRVLKVTNVEHLEFVHELSGPGFIAHVQELASDGNHGVPYRIAAENQYALSARIARRGISVDESSLHALRPEFNAMLEDRSKVELRALFNPNRFTAPESEWNEQLGRELGSHGVFNARMRAVALQLRSGTDPSYYRMIGDHSMPGAPPTALSRFHAKYVELEKLAAANHDGADRAELIHRAAQSVVDDWMLSDDGMHLLEGRGEHAISYMREAITHELYKTEISPQYRAMLTDTSRSPYAKVLNSEWAHTQVFSPYDGLDGEGYLWGHQRASQNIIHGTRLLSEEVSGARTIQDFGHRLSLEAGGVPISLSYRGAEGWVDAGRTLDRIAPQVLQQAAREDGGERARAYISRVIENSGLNMTVDQVVGHVRAFKAQSGDNFADLPAWKTATASMGFSDHPLSQIVKAINLDEAGAIGTFKQGVLRRQSQIRETGATQEAERVARYGDVLLDMIENLQRQHPHTSAAAIHNVAMHDFLQTHGEEGMKFFRVQGPDADYTKIIDHPDLWRRATAMSNQVMDKVDFSENVDQLRDEAASAAWGEGLLGSDARVFESRYMMNAESRRMHVTATAMQAAAVDGGTTIAGSPVKDPLKREVHTAVSRAMSSAQGAGNARARTEMETMHELMTNASILRTMRVPLLAAGGVLAAMAARTPTDDGFTMGNVSKGFGVGQPYAARYSEIPGSDKSRTVWDGGDPTPFQLDITFEGFVKRKEDMEMIQRHVYDTVAGVAHAQVRNTQVDDNRERSHVQNARNMLRRNI